MNEKTLAIAGFPLLVAEAAALAQEIFPTRPVTKIELPVEDRFKIDLSPLANLDPLTYEVFIAVDQRAANFSRFEVMSHLKGRGFGLARLFSSRASAPQDPRIGENTIVHPGTVLSSEVRIGYNVVIRSSCVIEASSRIGNSAYLASGTIVGAHANIGDFTTLGPGVVVAAGVKVGKQCEISIPGVYEEDIPTKTFYSPGYDTPVRIIRF